MDSDALAPRQFAALAGTLGRQRDHPAEIRARMEAPEFPGDDAFYRSMLRSREALSNATDVAASKANRAAMQGRPWAGDKGSAP